MMDFDRAKTVLKDSYRLSGLEIVSEEAREFVLRYHDNLFIVTDDDIQEYASSAMLREMADNMAVECGLVSLTYREQVVQPLDPIRWRHLPPLELGFVFGDPNGTDMYVTVGAATTDFCNYFRFDPVYLQICLERMMRAPESSEPLDIRHAFYRPPTIRVHNLAETSTDAALKASSGVVEFCLFELSYLKHLPVGLADEWPALRRLGEEGFRYGDLAEGSRLPMPPAEFNGDVVQFYQMGVSSRIPVLQYWAFYQVLEYFFVRSSDESLHQQLATRLKDPRFKPSPAQLDRLVQDVLDHLQDMDETAMLENVIKRYVSEEELVDFIEQYEAYLGEPLYTRRRRVFGDDIEVKLSPGLVVPGIARTIWAIRDNMMFSPDRYARTARTITFERLTEAIRPEIPLMKFLAERVIIGSAI